MRISTNKKIAAIALGAIAVSGTGVAYAYWSTQGTGSGSATTAAGAAAAFLVTGDVAGTVHPGDLAQTVTATVENTGSESYRVAKLQAFVTTNKSNCDGSNYLINGSAAPSTQQTAVDLAIAPVDLAPSVSATKTFTFRFNNLAEINQDACKGAAVTVHYLAS